MSAVKWVLAGIGTLALVVGLAIAGWQLNWFVQASATNHIAHIYQHSYGAQSGDEAQVQNLISQVATIDTQIADPSTAPAETSALAAQKAAIVTQACDLIANIDSPTPDVAQFASVNCG